MGVIGNADPEHFGLPQFLTTTYDHFGFERHRAVVYNAHIYLTALQAAEKLAEAVDDHAVVTKAQAAMARGQQAIVDDTLLWNSTSKFFRCHTSEAWRTYVKIPGATMGTTGSTSTSLDFFPQATTSSPCSTPRTRGAKQRVTQVQHAVASVLRPTRPFQHPRRLSGATQKRWCTLSDRLRRPPTRFSPTRFT